MLHVQKLYYGVDVTMFEASEKWRHVTMSREISRVLALLTCVGEMREGLGQLSQDGRTAVRSYSSVRRRVIMTTHQHVPVCQTHTLINTGTEMQKEILQRWRCIIRKRKKRTEKTTQTT